MIREDTFHGSESGSSAIAPWHSLQCFNLIEEILKVLILSFSIRRALGKLTGDWAEKNSSLPLPGSIQSQVGWGNNLKNHICYRACAAESAIKATESLFIFLQTLITIFKQAWGLLHCCLLSFATTNFMSIPSSYHLQPYHLHLLRGIFFEDNGIW